MACNLTSALSVQVLLFGGLPDPVLELSRNASLAVCDALPTTPSCAPTTVLGFGGFRLLPSGPTVHPGDAAMKIIMATPEFARLEEPVRTHVASRARRSAQDGCMPPEPKYEKTKFGCKNTPIKGPDDPKLVNYSPKTDDDGCFVTEQGENNCYNYGTDTVTNTFAQPGRGSGVCSKHARPCVPNTCDDVRRGAVSDGLIWKGTELPTTLPAIGHYVSLHIWPDSNFHWLRMDSNFTWSHKPGGSPVRDVDNNGKTIVDPAKCDVSPWTQHCGYFIAQPSKTTPA